MNGEPDRRTVASYIAADGTIVESVLNAASGETRFVVGAVGRHSIVEEWASGGTTLRPIPARNNLIAHGAVLLPSNPAEYSSEEALVLEIEDHFQLFVNLSEADRQVAAAYVLLSWVHDAFNELGYLRFRGDYGTGKSRALMVVGALCYKPFFASGALTVSPIFHTLDSFGCTLVLDEADFRFTDEKAELVKILNNGFMKGFPVLRTQVNQKREFDPRAFNVFGPKIVAMRGEYQDKALESRFFTIEMTPGHADGVPINLPDEHAAAALAIRNKLLSYRLQNRFRVGVRPEFADPSLEPRMNQILLPLLSVAPTESAREAILARARRGQARAVVARSASTEGLVLSVLRELHAERPETVSVGQLAERMTALHGAEYGRPITGRFVGAALRRLGIATYKRHGVFVVAPNQDATFVALYERFGVTAPEPTLP